MGVEKNGCDGMKEIKWELKHDNCKDCHSKCEHAGKDREFCYRGESCKKGAMTNGDKIRSMSDEELVVFLDHFSGNCVDCAKDGKNNSCKIYKEGRFCIPKDIMEWLKKTAE